jgi:hypothetical protein
MMTAQRIAADRNVSCVVLPDHGFTAEPIRTPFRLAIRLGAIINGIRRLFRNQLDPQWSARNQANAGATITICADDLSSNGNVRKDSQLLFARWAFDDFYRHSSPCQQSYRSVTSNRLQDSVYLWRYSHREQMTDGS